MYNRLVTFGCSLTYGHGLIDCHGKRGTPGPLPSQYAWPQILANNLGIECINCSEPGASDKQIWKTILDTPLYPEDLVIVHWSHLDRWCIIEEDFVNKIGFWNTKKNKQSKVFFKYLHNEYDMLMDLNCRSDHIERYLTDLGIEHYHLLVHDNYRKHIARWNSAKICSISTNEIRKILPRALDGSHPGPEAHKELANQIYKEIHDFN